MEIPKLVLILEILGHLDDISQMGTSQVLGRALVSLIIADEGNTPWNSEL